MPPRFSFLFLVANAPWVYALAEQLAVTYPTHVTWIYDGFNYRRLLPEWQPNAPPLLQRSLKVLPPGYVGRLEPIFRPFLQWQVQAWFQRLEQVTGTKPWIVVPYPHAAPWVRPLPAERLIYYNLDDYTLYRPSRKAVVLKQEAELVNRSALTLCIAQSQVNSLKQRFPHRAALIHHFPLGVVDAFVNPEPGRSPESMTVGYIGNLTDRVDWHFVHQVSAACPDVTFEFIGQFENHSTDVADSNWQQERDAVLSLPNVRYRGAVPQSSVRHFYWQFAMHWIPYDTNHPFNQASCPTKIMDGIASGRPILSTDIPECRLYPDWIQIVHSVEGAVSCIRLHLSRVDTPTAQEKCRQQCCFAQQNTWAARANQMLPWLSL